ncbi:MAG: RNA polymerase sigma factor [Porcipelethomonas sp.]
MTGTEYSILYRRSAGKAYEVLFDQYCNYVYAIVYNKLCSVASREDIEECVSDIFAEIYFNYDTKSGYQGDMKGYINTIAKRMAINKYHHLTSRLKHTAAIEEEHMAQIGSGENMEEESDNAELRCILLNKINELGEPDSTIILQRYYYDRSSREIAELLSMKSSAVRMRCKRAMSRLKNKLEKIGIAL